MNATELSRVSGRGGGRPANATELERGFFCSKAEANDVLVGVCIGVSFIVELSGLSAADACLPKAPCSGTVILDNFFEKFLDVRLPKLVPIPPSGNCSVRDVVLRIPGLVTKGFVDVKKGFASSATPPAA